MEVVVHDSVTLAAPADSVEFCPQESLNNFFACGNYELRDRVQQVKVGGVYIFQTPFDDSTSRHFFVRVCSFNLLIK